jgi:hypothetical protein
LGIVYTASTDGWLPLIFQATLGSIRWAVFLALTLCASSGFAQQRSCSESEAQRAKLKRIVFVIGTTFTGHSTCIRSATMAPSQKDIASQLPGFSSITRRHCLDSLNLEAKMPIFNLLLSSTLTRHSLWGTFGRLGQTRRSGVHLVFLVSAMS